MTGRAKPLPPCLRAWDSEDGMHHQCLHPQVGTREHGHVCPCGATLDERQPARTVEP